MRPIKLTLEGLRSYQDKTTIDFTDLTLFALIGDTGAGKSSIIEALSLALYNCTTWSGRGVAELMSDANDRMSVELVFHAEDDTWTVTRSHRRTGGPATHKLTSATGEKVDGADAVNRRIQGLLGLNRDQFLRAVVMPQGQFEKLLRASPGERTDILKGIFRLQALDQVRNEVGTITGRWKGPIAELQGERRTLPPDTAAAVAAATEAHRDAAATAQRLDEQAQKATTAERDAHDAAQAAAKLGELRATAVDLLDRVSVEQLRRIIEIATDLEARTSQTTSRRDGAGDAADVAQAAATEALAGFASRDAAVTGAAELRQVAATLTSHATSCAVATAALAELEAAPPATAIPAALQEEEAVARAAVADAEEQVRAAEDAHSDARRAYAAWSNACAHHERTRVTLSEATEGSASATDSLQTSWAAVEAADLTVVSAREAREVAVRSNAAAAAAAGCVPGDHCPVCTQPLPATFSAPVATDLDSADAVLADASEEAARVRAEHQSLATAAASASARQNAAAAALEEAREALASAEEVLLPCVDGEVRSDLSEADALARPAQVLDERRAAAAQASERADKASAAAGDARSAVAVQKSRWESKRDEHTEDLRLAEQAIETARCQLDQLPSQWRPAADANPSEIGDVADKIQEALERNAEHTAVATQRRSEFAAANTELADLAHEETTTVIQPRDLALSAAAQAHATLDDLEALVSTGDENALPPAPSADDPLVTIAERVGAIRVAGEELTTMAAGRADELATAASTHADEVKAVLAATGATAIAALVGQAGAATANAQHAKTELERTEAAAARANQIDATLEVAVPFLAALEALKALLADGKFIGHLVREREVALLVEASRVLRRVSQDRFGFADGFKVIDLRAGRERSPDTLSGGERFQASLALALALVEIATRGGGQLEAVFVDEGFGSLDAGALDQALSTLGGVASDGKLVALVSHLRQVGEYVDQVLLVERDDATGSSVHLLDQSERDALLAEDARSRMTA